MHLIFRRRQWPKAVLVLAETSVPSLGWTGDEILKGLITACNRRAMVAQFISPLLSGESQRVLFGCG